MIVKQKEIKVNGEYAFHVESTHGIPKEYLEDWLNGAIQEH